MLISTLSQIVSARMVFKISLSFFGAAGYTVEGVSEQIGTSALGQRCKGLTRRVIERVQRFWGRRQ